MPMPSARIRRISSNSTSISRLVRLAVGSSMITTRDLNDMALAISTSCCWAVESRATGRRGSRSVDRALSSSALRLIHLAGVLEPAPARFAAEEDVVRHVQIGAEVELLVDEGHALLSGVPRVGQDGPCAGDFQFAPIRRDDAAQDLHQGALSGAVLAHQHVHFSRKEVEIHVLQDLHVGVAERPAVARRR